MEFYEAGSWAEDGLDAAPAALPAPLHSSSTVFKDHLALDWGWGAPAEVRLLTVISVQRNP